MKVKASGIGLLVLLFLAGCGGTAAAFQPTATRVGTQTTAPSGGAQPNVLQVVRPSLVGYQQQALPSFEKTVSDPAAVQKLYAAALALPRPSQYPLPCPNDMGLKYQLTFLVGTSPLQQMEVQPLGCQWVYLSQTDVRRADQAFLQLLAHTIGLPSLIPAGLLPSS